MNDIDMKKKTLRRKANQAWEMAGLARVDGDHKEEAKWTEKAREYERELGWLIRENL